MQMMEEDKPGQVFFFLNSLTREGLNASRTPFAAHHRAWFSWFSKLTIWKGKKEVKERWQPGRLQEVQQFSSSTKRGIMMLHLARRPIRIVLLLVETFSSPSRTWKSVLSSVVVCLFSWYLSESTAPKNYLCLPSSPGMRRSSSRRSSTRELLRRLRRGEELNLGGTVQPWKWSSFDNIDLCW